MSCLEFYGLSGMSPRRREPRPGENNLAFRVSEADALVLDRALRILRRTDPFLNFSDILRMAVREFIQRHPEFSPSTPSTPTGT